jgi:hypothetical protein
MSTSKRTPSRMKDQDFQIAMREKRNRRERQMKRDRKLKQKGRER